MFMRFWPVCCRLTGGASQPCWDTTEQVGPEGHRIKDSSWGQTRQLLGGRHCGSEDQEASRKPFVGEPSSPLLPVTTHGRALLVPPCL